MFAQTLVLLCLDNADRSNTCIGKGYDVVLCACTSCSLPGFLTSLSIVMSTSNKVGLSGSMYKSAHLGSLVARFQLGCHTLEHMLQLIHFALQPFKPTNLQHVDFMVQAFFYCIPLSFKASNLQKSDSCRSVYTLLTCSLGLLSQLWTCMPLHTQPDKDTRKRTGHTIT